MSSKVSFSDSDYSDTSSESDGSDADATTTSRAQQPRPKVVKKKRVDAAEYNRQQAREEWKHATGAASLSSSSAPNPAPKRVVPQMKATAAKTSASGTDATNTSGTKEAKPRPPMVGRLREAGEDMAMWFKPSEESTLMLDDGLTVEPVVNNNLAPKLTAPSRPTPAAGVSPGRNRSANGAAANTSTEPTPSKSAFVTSSANPEVDDSTALVAASKVQRIYPEEDEVNPSTIPEEGKTVSRKEFLDFLDLLGGDSDAEDSSPRRKESAEEVDGAGAGMQRTKSGEGMERNGSSGAVYRDAVQWDTDPRKQQQLQSEELKARLGVDATSTDDFTAYSRRKGLEKVSEDDPMDPAAALSAYYHTKAHLKQQAEYLVEFQTNVLAFEEVLTSSYLTDKMTSFLELHHKEFLDSQPQRAKGEFTHREYSLFNMYSEGIQHLIVKEMKKMVGEFDVDNFVSELFDQEQQRLEMEAESRPPASSSDEEGSGGDDHDTEHKDHNSFLSVEAWDVLLSIIKFENFEAMMDEFIEAFYGVEIDGDKTITSGGSLKPSSTSTAGRPAGPKLQASPPPGSRTSGTPPSTSAGGSVGGVAGAKSRSFREMRNLPNNR